MSIEYFLKFLRTYLTCHKKELSKIGEMVEKPNLISEALPMFKDVFGNIANLHNLLVSCHHQYIPLFVLFSSTNLVFLKRNSTTLDQRFITR